jgi:hypothetical protein
VLSWEEIKIIYIYKLNLFYFLKKINLIFFVLFIFFSLFFFFF